MTYNCQADQQNCPSHPDSIMTPSSSNISKPITTENTTAAKHPSDCEPCTPWTQIPDARTEISFTAIGIVLSEIWKNFFCAWLVWQWTIIYILLLLGSRYIFQEWYYPNIVKSYSNRDNDRSLSAPLRFRVRSMTAASKFISFFAASSNVIRCGLIWNKEYMSDENLKASMYIETPKEIDELMDSLLGYFVVDTVYLLLFRRRWMYIIHHQVAFVCTITLKSFGKGAHIGIPIYYIADSTTILLNVIWFIEDRLKYLQFYRGHPTNDGLTEKQIQRKSKKWDTILKIVQLLFALMFIYQRIWSLSCYVFPWMKNLLYAHHANLLHKFICVSQGAALLMTGYVWSFYVITVLYKAIKGLLNKNDNNGADKDKHRQLQNEQNIKHTNGFHHDNNDHNNGYKHGETQSGLRKRRVDDNSQ